MCKFGFTQKNQFYGRVEIYLHSAAGDTTIRVLNNQRGQLLHFTTNKAIDSIALDPSRWLVFGLDTIIHDTKLSVPEFYEAETKVFPNPATESWEAGPLPADCSLLLTDLTGRELWRGNSPGTSMTIPAKNLAGGLYILHITSSEGGSASYKLIRE